MTSGRILAPLDGSAESHAAVPLARTLAKDLNLPITLLHVPPQSEPPRYAQINLQEIADELAASGVAVEAVVRHGHAAEQILEEIQRCPVDMLVMRTHGRAGIERSILGSVTEQVLKHTRVPMILMRPGQRPVARIEKLLLAVDGSPAGAQAVKTAAALAQQTGAAIHVLQVVVPLAMQPMVADTYGIGYYDPAWDEDTVEAAKAYVHTLVNQLRDCGVAARGETYLAAAVAESVTEAADRHAVDLVVMSTHALIGTARAVLGSVSDAVVRTAHCPVLLVHRTERAEEVQASTPRASQLLAN